MAYSLDLRERIVSYVEAGHSEAEAAERYGVHRTTAGRYLKRKRSGKPLRADKPTGRRRLIDASKEKQLEAQVQAHDDDTLEQHCERWQKKQKVEVSVATMHRSVERLKFTRKKRH
jgi:transposase